MTDNGHISRRDALQGLLAIPAGLVLSPEILERARTHVRDALEAEQGAAPQGTTPAQPAAAQPRQYVPKQFTADEWRLVRVLADYVIPRDARSGSASEAGVPQFMDFILGEYASNRQWMKDGLAWTNAESRKRFGKSFISATDAQRRALLDAIAYPKKAAPEVKAGADFFTRFRNLTASGYYSSRIGIADLGYIGNRPIAQWEGTPPAVLKAMGLE